MTKQRQVVLDVIRSDMCHHTAEEIFDITKGILPGISRATVYNSLKYLEGQGLIRRITAENSSDRYDNSYIPHGHLFCTVCGAVEDFLVPGLEKSLEDIIKQSYSSYELKVRYICDGCRGSNLKDKNNK